MNNQVIIAQKDVERKKKTQQTSIITLFSKITIEDIYNWISYGYLQMKDNVQMIKKSFELAGIIPELDEQKMEIEMDGLINGFDEMEIEKLGDEEEPTPIQDDDLMVKEDIEEVDLNDNDI